MYCITTFWSTIDSQNAMVVPQYYNRDEIILSPSDVVTS